MAIKPITAYGFRGMDNLPEMPAKFLDDERRITPSLILNAEVTDGGDLRRRAGYVSVKTLMGCHSLAGNERGLNVMLCVADGTLYRVEGAQALPLATVSGPKAPLSYYEINNLVYMSSPYWNGVYDLLQEVVRPWGVMPPMAPDISLVAGDLPPGRYSLCYTRVGNGQLSGNGPLRQVSWEGDKQGIRLINLPTDGQCWITHPNGKKLLLASVANGLVTGQVPDAKLLPSFMVTPPPNFTHFYHAFGCIWGVSGKNLYYSFPHQHEWFRPQPGKSAWFIPFLEDLVMVAPVTEGLFINSKTSTWFLDGTNPAEMSMRRIGEGAVPGTLIYAQLPGAVVGGGYEISRRQSQLPSPVWVSKNGFVAGTHTGHLVHLTEARLKINPRAEGASLYQVKNGIPRVITTFWGPQIKAEPDTSVETILNNGRLFPSAPFEGVAFGNLMLTGNCILN